MSVEEAHVATIARGAEPPRDLTPSTRSSVKLWIGVVPAISGIVGAVLVLLALIGPWLAPHSIAAPVGPPFSPPSGAAPLGTDFLGRDVLSRVLSGGRSLVVLAFLATVLVTFVGAAVGLIAGFSKTILGAVIMRICDTLLILPPILILLVLATGYGGGNKVLLVAILVTASPFLARVTRAATLQIVGRGYVEAAVTRGERTWWILAREVAPNISGVLLAYTGLLFVSAVYLSAAASFLGVSAPPPAADWGRMIQEDMGGAALNAWAVASPATMLVVLAVSVNLFADGVQRRFASGNVRKRQRKRR
jgi:peptide/nickel transport system permease protein